MDDSADKTAFRFRAVVRSTISILNDCNGLTEQYRKAGKPIPEGDEKTYYSFAGKLYDYSWEEDDKAKPEKRAILERFWTENEAVLTARWRHFNHIKPEWDALIEAGEKSGKVVPESSKASSEKSSLKTADETPESSHNDPSVQTPAPSQDESKQPTSTFE